MVKRKRSGADVCFLCNQPWSAPERKRASLEHHVYADHCCPSTGRIALRDCWCGAKIYAVQPWSDMRKKDASYFGRHFETHGGVLAHWLAYHLGAEG